MTNTHTQLRFDMKYLYLEYDGLCMTVVVTETMTMQPPTPCSSPVDRATTPVDHKESMPMVAMMHQATAAAIQMRGSTPVYLETVLLRSYKKNSK